MRGVVKGQVVCLTIRTPYLNMGCATTFEQYIVFVPSGKTAVDGRRTVRVPVLDATRGTVQLFGNRMTRDPERKWIRYG